jgi:thiamine pyrophosphokinase
LPKPKRAVIFANGVLSHPEAVLRLVESEDLLIAADGGARLCRQLGLIPSVLIGDFDSLDEDEVASLIKSGVQVIRHPRRKDFTDLELALRHAQSLGIREVVVFAALGARWDQTLANLLLPAAAGLAGMRIGLADGSQEVMLLRGGEELVLHGHSGDTVSLVPIGGNATGVTTHGLEYPLQDETLYFGATRGLSNVLLDDGATIYSIGGLLLCVVIHQKDGG